MSIEGEVIDVTYSTERDVPFPERSLTHVVYGGDQIVVHLKGCG